MSGMPIYMDEHVEWPLKPTITKTVRIEIDNEEATLAMLNFFDSMTAEDVAKLSDEQRDWVAKQITGWLRKFENCRTEAEKARD